MKNKDAAKISIAEIVANAGRDGFIHLLALFTVPNIFLVPSFSFFPWIFGVPAILVSLQFLVGAQHIWLPKFLGQQKIPATMLSGHHKIMGYLVGYHYDGEAGSKNPSAMGDCLYWAPWRHIIALTAIGYTILLCLPLPLLTGFAAIGILVFMVGLLREIKTLVVLGVVLLPVSGLLMYWTTTNLGNFIWGWL